MQLSNFIRTYDNAFSDEFCQSLIAKFESKPELLRQNGSIVRAGLEESNWVELDIGRYSDADTRDVFLETIKKYKEQYEKDCQIVPALPDAQKYAELIIKRYNANSNEKFQPHYDSVGPTAGRYLVFLWYLNDVEEGGETEFMDLGISVKPKAGTMLIFPPYWMYRHEAHIPITNPKYILSTYAMW